ncbi:uncharacterized protein LOC125857037 [Solanum stenotomum]|uniref:uncharacterized protein LOC125857037 n=1 Tax=Solanum stenotomum TaxID=172797 RepID=UPI0020D06170|nr:uncharacterized protein LOC125857037 [Solanum stenotomum]
MKFTQLSPYATEIIAKIWSRMSLFVFGLSCLSSKEGKAAMLIGDMDIQRLMIYVQQVEEDKQEIGKSFGTRRLRQQEMSPGSRNVMQTGHPFNISQMDLLYHLLVHLHKKIENDHFMSKFSKNMQGNGNGGNRAQSSSVDPPARAVPRGAT